MDVWFEWGFILILISMVGILLALVATTSKNSLLTKISGIIIFAGSFLGVFIWTLAGLAIRFNTAANICSGDGAYSSWTSRGGLG
jgi:ABC-type dipeptide/oligopeptide/nickel transport system permease component